MQSDIERYTAAWPAEDREKWLSVFEDPDSIETLSSVAANWRQQTRFDYTVGYTHWLRWRAARYALQPNEGPPLRCSPALLNGYVRDLEAQGYKSTTIHTRVMCVDRVLSQISPDLDRAFITRQVKKLSRHPDVGQKGARLKESAVLIQVGVELMETARRGTSASRRDQVRYRTGMQIALLAARPLRLRNFANLELAKNVYPEGTGYRIHVDASDTKRSKTIDLPFPADLIPFYEEYIAVCREALRGSYPGRRVWVSSRGGPMGVNGIYKKIVAHTKEVFGPNEALNPHLFRDCLATSIAVDDPSEWDLAHRLLGNAASTVARTYDHGSTREAGLKVSAFLSEIHRDR